MKHIHNVTYCSFDSEAGRTGLKNAYVQKMQYMTLVQECLP